MKYLAFVRERFSKKDFPTFTAQDLKMSLKHTGIGVNYIYLMVHNLLRRKEIIRITRAVYTFHKDEAVVGFAFYPFYYGFENALNIRGISEQGTNLIVVTPRNVRQGVRTFAGRNYRIKRIGGGMFFGYETMEYDGFTVPVSDVEKTVIDMLYFHDHIREELWPEIARRMDMKKFRDYLKRYDGRFAERALAEAESHMNKKRSTEFMGRKERS